MEIEKYQWSKDDTLKLIRLYKGFPYLWNSSLPDHRDKEKRAKAMIKIAKDFKISVPEIQRKLHNLRCSFNQEIRRLKNKNYFSSWEYFDSMYFVAGQYKRRSLNPNASSLELRSFKTEEAGNSRNSLDEEIPLNEISPGKKRNLDAMLVENGCTFNKICHIAREDDDFQTFGNFVGSELRSLTCPNKRDDLKRMILQNILTVSDVSYVSPSLNISNSHVNQNSPSLHSIISVEPVNEAGSIRFGNYNDHEFHVNNVKLEK